MSRKKDRVRALVAEDHLVMRARIVDILEKEFYVMAAVADGDELIHAARVLQPDVIVSDVMMPKLSGPEAKELLVESGVDIPFVFLTTDCPAAQQTWGDLNPCIKKVDLLGELTPAVRNAALRGGTKSLRQTCEILPPAVFEDLRSAGVNPE